MDSIERNNKERLIKKYVHGTVITKEQNNSLFKVKFVVIACTEDIIKDIIKNKALDNNTNQQLKDLKIINNTSDVKEVLYYGDLTNFTGYSNIIYKFPLRKKDILEGKDPHYRLYTRTYKYQLENMWLLNLCRTAYDSWKSVIEKLGTTHGLVLKIKINN